MSPNSWPARVVVVDVEGNGANPPDLIEVAAVPVTPAGPGTVREWLIRPPAPIQRRVTRIHGITNTMVADAPAWSEIVDQVRGILDGAWLVAHSASVEYGCLTRHLPGWQPEGVIDTLRAAKAVYPGAPGYGLDAVIDHTGVDVSHLPGKRHRAAYDAAATALLLLHLAARFPTWEDLAAAATPPALSRTPAPPKELQLW